MRSTVLLASASVASASAIIPQPYPICECHDPSREDRDENSYLIAGLFVVRSLTFAYSSSRHSKVLPSYSCGLVGQ